MKLPGEHTSERSRVRDLEARVERLEKEGPGCFTLFAVLMVFWMLVSFHAKDWIALRDEIVTLFSGLW